MTDEERAALRAAMYQSEPDVEEDSDSHKIEPDHVFDFEVAGKFVTLTLDGKKIDIATARYVHALERTVVEQERKFLRINSELKKLRHALNQHANELNDVNRELDRKINMRDLP